MDEHSLEIGLGFGVTSAVITTVGLIVGLDSSTHSQATVLGGIIVIAIADALSDALGIHTSEEFEGVHTTREIWESTVMTFIAKFIFALTFAIPIILLPLSQAVVVDVVWGLLLLVLLGHLIAKKEKESRIKVIGEHLVVAIVVIAAARYLGSWVSVTFG
ncbi:MAG: hypothetical protein QW590_02285 [Candidatus Bilamarchaeaceae archaeon]